MQEGDGLDDASEALLQARRYVCDSEGSRAAEVEAEPGGVVPSERAEIQVRSDRATGARDGAKAQQTRCWREMDSNSRSHLRERASLRRAGWKNRSSRTM